MGHFVYQFLLTLIYNLRKILGFDEIAGMALFFFGFGSKMGVDLWENYRELSC